MYRITSKLNRLDIVFLCSKITEDYGIIRQAFSALALYFPLVITYYAYVWLTVFVKNNDEILDSIMDAEGITFNVKDKKTGPYSLEMPFRK